MDWSLFIIFVALFLGYVMIESLILILKDIEIGIKNNLDSTMLLHEKINNLQTQKFRKDDLEEFPQRKESPLKPLAKTNSSMSLKQLFHNKFYHNA